ncbi:hypothetical protein PYCC9005_004076 [Savitreella phatthalungensis]
MSLAFGVPGIASDSDGVLNTGSASPRVTRALQAGLTTLPEHEALEEFTIDLADPVLVQERQELNADAIDSAVDELTNMDADGQPRRSSVSGPTRDDDGDTNTGVPSTITSPESRSTPGSPALSRSGRLVSTGGHRRKRSGASVGHRRTSSAGTSNVQSRRNSVTSDRGIAEETYPRKSIELRDSVIGESSSMAIPTIEVSASGVENENEEADDDDEFGDFDDFDAFEEASVTGSPGSPCDPLDTSAGVHSEELDPVALPIPFPDLTSPASMMGAMNAHLDRLFPETSPTLKTPFSPATQTAEAEEDGEEDEEDSEDWPFMLTDRACSLWRQLMAPPALSPPEWRTSRIRRLFLVSLGIPVDLDDLLPRVKHKKLVLPRATTNTTHTTHRTHIARGSIATQAHAAAASLASARDGDRKREDVCGSFDVVGARLSGGSTETFVRSLPPLDRGAHLRLIGHLNGHAKLCVEALEKEEARLKDQVETFGAVIENLVKFHQHGGDSQTPATNGVRR